MAKLRFRSGSSISDYCPHPKGTYLSCTFNPNSEWPGTTWVQQAQGNYLVSAGSTYVSGRSYGSNTHMLNINEIPSHTHSFHGFAANKGWYSGDQNYFAVFYDGGSNNTAYNAYAGGSQAHNNMPQSIAVPLWLRTA